ncbi:MAG: hypothetical protein L0287_03160, partial [Anaerolineae bacterium]|nr:hypothetical protein [Anaerolineae bacterium]
VDKAWEQEKPEATLREMLENAARAKRSPTRQVHLGMMAGDHFPRKKPSIESILRMSKSTSRTKQWMAPGRHRGAPWLPVQLI